MDWMKREDWSEDQEDTDAFLTIDDDAGTAIIGIDFGTTYSGVAWATVDELVDKPENIHLIVKWPHHGLDEAKAPTELCYGEQPNEVKWGFDVPADAKSIRWFKMLLLKDEDLSDELRQSAYLKQGREFLHENKKSAVDVISDYLRQLWKHTIQTIVRELGQTVVDALVFRVVITVPAIWKGYARQAMKDAAIMAGIMAKRLAGPTTLTLESEPEAAALATLVERGRRPKVGGVYVVCDAGGGTTDLITYKVEQLAPVTLSEVVEGQGALCGGALIDEAFENICKSRFGRQWSSLSKSAIRTLMKDWEKGIKPQFSQSNANRVVTVRMPNEVYAGGGEMKSHLERGSTIKDGSMYFEGSTIKTIFDKCFQEISRIVEQQVQQVKARGSTSIILVGGLGSSPYLYDFLSAVYAKRDISIVQATNNKPRTAICRGAVLKGFIGESATAQVPVSIASTISRISVGTEFRTPFESSKHLEEDKVWDFMELEYKATKQMHWYLEKGENVSTYKPTRMGFYRMFRPEEVQFYSKTFTERLLQSTHGIAPSRKTADVASLCNIVFNFNLEQKDFEDYTNSQGKKFKKLVYEIEMTPSGASADFAIYVGGKKQGANNVAIRFQ